MEYEIRHRLQTGVAGTICYDACQKIVDAVLKNADISGVRRLLIVDEDTIFLLKMEIDIYATIRGFVFAKSFGII